MACARNARAVARGVADDFPEGRVGCGLEHVEHRSAEVEAADFGRAGVVRPHCCCCQAASRCPARVAEAFYGGFPACAPLAQSVREVDAWGTFGVIKARRVGYGVFCRLGRIWGGTGL